MDPFGDPTDDEPIILGGGDGVTVTDEPVDDDVFGLGSPPADDDDQGSADVDDAPAPTDAPLDPFNNMGDDDNVPAATIDDGGDDDVFGLGDTTDDKVNPAFIDEPVDDTPTALRYNRNKPNPPTEHHSCGGWLSVFYWCCPFFYTFFFSFLTL